MKNLKLAAFCGVAILGAMSPVQAEDMLMGIARSVYIEGRIGIPYTGGTESTVTSSVAAANGTTETEFDSGNFASAAVGVTVMPNVRVDVEVSRIHAHDATIAFKSGFTGNAFAGQTLDALGDTDVWSYLLNVYYDFPEVLPGLRPFIGGGIGASSITVDNLAPLGSRFQVHDRDTVMAGAVHLGAAYQIAPQFWLTARYSAGFTGGPTFNGTDTANAGGTMKVESDGTITHIFGVGLRFAFN